MTDAATPAIHFAWDASVHADWIARYALRLAARSPSRSLRILHVGTRDDGARERYDTLAREAAAVGVAPELVLIPPTGDVARALDEAVPDGPEHLLVGGLRVRSRHGRGYVSGTVSRGLLEAASCHVLALRVLDPGRLGRVRRALFAVDERPTTAADLQPLVELLGPDLDELLLFRVREVSTRAFERLTENGQARHLREARALLDSERARFRERLEPHGVLVDALAVVSDDWPKEVLLHAGRLGVDLVVLGATARSLPERFFFGNALEQVVRSAPCDVAVFRHART